MSNNLKQYHLYDLLIERKAEFKTGIDLPKQKRKKVKVERERKDDKQHNWTFL